MKKPKRVSEGAVLPRDRQIKAAVEGLRHFVDNFNVSKKIALRDHNTYKDLQKDNIYTTCCGWEFGYKLEEYPTYFKRKVTVRCLNYNLDEVPDEERKTIVVAVFDAALDRGSGIIDIEQTDHDCLLITQSFMPMFLEERNPRQIVPGGTGRP